MAKSVSPRRAKALTVTGSTDAKSAPPAAPPEMSPAERGAREEVIATALAMSRSGLSPGRSGNVSRRWIDSVAGPGMLITPSGVPYAEIRSEGIVFVADDGRVPDGQLKPSSEWRFHLSAYHARPDRHAIVHTHSMHAVVIACAGRPIPAFHYMVAIAGAAEIPCVPYATFGTDKLARHIARGLKQADACLMANHGQIAIASTLSGALDLAREVEILAEQYAKLLMLGPPVILKRKEMRDVLTRFVSYGQHAQAETVGKPAAKGKRTAKGKAEADAKAAPKPKAEGKSKSKSAKSRPKV